MSTTNAQIDAIIATLTHLAHADLPVLEQALLGHRRSRLRAWRPSDSEAVVIEVVPVDDLSFDPDDPDDHRGADLYLQGIDTARHLDDAQVAFALAREPILSDAARYLAKLHGKPVARPDVERRINANPKLAYLHRLADELHWEFAIRMCKQKIAEREAERAQAAERRAARQKRRPARRLRKLSRCGARTRTGRPCQRMPEVGKRRCRNHGGCATGPKTPEGRARSLEALKQRWKNRKPAGHGHADVANKGLKARRSRA